MLPYRTLAIVQHAPLIALRRVTKKKNRLFNVTYRYASNFCEGKIRKLGLDSSTLCIIVMEESSHWLAGRLRRFLSQQCKYPLLLLLLSTLFFC